MRNAHGKRIAKPVASCQKRSCPEEARLIVVVRIVIVVSPQERPEQSPKKSPQSQSAPSSFPERSAGTPNASTIPAKEVATPAHWKADNRSSGNLKASPTAAKSGAV